MEKYKLLDVEKNLFNELPDEEKKERLGENPEGAIEQYGLELAMKSKDIERELSPEEKERFEMLKKSAGGILKSFRQNPANLEQGAVRAKNKENLVIVVEKDVDELVRLAFFEEAIKDFENEARMVVIKNLETSGAEIPEAVRQKMLSATNILLLGIRSMTHSKATLESWKAKDGKDDVLKKWLQDEQVQGKMLEHQFPELSKEQLAKWQKMYSGASIISIPDAFPESFLHECYAVDKKEVDRNVKKIGEIMKRSKAAKITSPAGTDIVIELDAEKYGVEEELASIGRDEGMNAMNAPSGETATRPKNINGRFVMDGFCADNPLNLDKNANVVHPIVINFENGKATIEGGNPEADNLIRMCELAKKRSAESGSEKDPYQIAEFAIGVLGKPLPDGKINFTLNNATIDEKLSLHLAIGADHMLGGENDVPIHIDFGGQFITVTFYDNKEMQENENTVTVLENGKLMIDNQINQYKL